MSPFDASEPVPAELPAVDDENLRLLELLEAIRERHEEACRALAVLNEIVEQLPIGVTVQSCDGRLLLANGAAAEKRAVHAAAASDDSEPDPSAPQEALREPRALDMADSATPSTSEEHLAGPRGERTYLTIEKQIHMRDEALLLSASLDITDRKQVEDKLLQRAFFDELTRLPNRCMVQEHVERVLAKPNCRFALAFLDIDNFKHINDYYSHAVGDALLVKVAQRVVENIRPTDMLARISGDEFLLLIDPLESDDELASVINNLIDQLKAPFLIEGFEILTSASIGVSIYPEHGRDYETLRRNADSAMYQVKSGIKGGAVVFDLQIGQTITARMKLEQRLRLAVRDSRFRCAFQPKVDIQTQEVTGVEALIRLLDEDGMLQAPSSFIELAVELGLIDNLAHLALDQIVSSIDLLDDAFGPQATISINVAAKQATDVAFMRGFIGELKNTGFPERFMVEVTEDAFLAKSRFQADVLPMLREIGVRVSIDDFGTGYSSLSALAEITADEIKIDRSFITDIHQRARSQSVLKAIESLGDALGMTVIAEGVETFEELAYLRTMTHIRFAQGYYFAKPLFFEDFAPMHRINAASRTTSRDGPAKPRLRSRSR